MVNFCYAYPIIFDNDGMPLRGRLDFCEPGTTTPKNVFDVNGNSLGSSIDTTDEGFPGESQIFINGATDCRVYKGVELQYVMRLVDVSAQGGAPSGSGSSVGSIDDLRGLEVPDDGATVTSTGYNAPGDMTPQLYVFSASSTAEDDGGGVVKPDSVEASAAGRWLLVPQRYIDCRAFGIMPVDNVEGSPDSYSPVELFTFAASVGRDVWFPAIQTLAYSYYVLVSGTYACGTCIHVDKGVRFRNTSSSNTVGLSSAGIDSPGFKFEYGTFNVSCPVFRTSWIGTTGTVNYTPSERLIVDSDVPVTASGCSVEFVATVNNQVVLNTCDIVCRYKLSTSYVHSFTRCRVTDRYFTNPSNVDVDKVLLSECVLDIDEFASSDNWAEFAMKQGESFLDFHGRSVGTLTLETSSSYTVENADVTVLSILSGVSSVTFINCRVNAAHGIRGNIICENTSLRFESNKTVTGILKLTGGSIISANGAAVTCGSLYLYNCEVNCPITAATAFVHGCWVAKAITTTGVSNVQTVQFVGNVFLGDGTHVMDVESGAVAYDCVWKDNHFGGAVMAPMLGLFATEGHTYTYEGNTGNCMPTSVRNVNATSGQAVGMNEGWRIVLGFQNVTVSLFAIGNYKIRVRYHADVSLFFASAYQNAGASSSAIIDAGWTRPTSIPTGAVAMPDLTTELGTNIKNAAISTPGIIKGYVDVEVV